MRLIAGIYGGRIIQSPPGHKTHPMSEKMRGAIFNALGDITGLSLLDAYSGSGAVALEAYSRGAKNIISVDSDKKAIQTIKLNAEALQANIKVTQANISSWVDNNLRSRFDIVVADPPYDKINPTQLQKLTSVVKDGGVIIFSLPPTYKLPQLDNFQLISVKEYGNSSLAFYRLVG